MSNHHLVTRFGEKLSWLRKQKGLSLRALAHEFGYKTHSYLNEVELGRKDPTVELVLQVSRFFDVTTDQLLKDEIEIMIPSAAPRKAKAPGKKN